MQKFWSLFRLLLLVFAGIWFIIQHFRKKKFIRLLLGPDKETLAKERQALIDFYNEHKSLINSARTEFANLMKGDNGYFPYNLEKRWLEKYKTLNQDILARPIKDGVLPDEVVTDVNWFADAYRRSATKRYDYNKRFIQNELFAYRNFFDNIEGRKLDLQQRTAVIADEDNSIIIAGAGSGKTTTIVGKVNYILDRYKVDPSQILLISFTAKSAQTLAERIGNKRIDVKTFHKLGKDIIAAVDGKQPTIYDQAQFKGFIKKSFLQLQQDPVYLEKVTTYFTDFLKPHRSPFDFDNRGDYVQYIKDQNFRSYKQVPVGKEGTLTYKQEIVKSIEECKIANFLLFNGIDYHYEKQYEFETADENHGQYRPDFTIIQGDIKVYLEHCGVSKSDDVPHFFAKHDETYEEAKERYWQKINWARETHANHQTTLIETFSYEMNDDSLFRNLTDKLIAAGITLYPMTPEEIWQIINQAAEDEVDSLIALFQTFIILMKSNDYAVRDILSKSHALNDKFMIERTALFMQIIQPIYDRYEEMLAGLNEIDFSDMINKAAEYVRTQQFNPGLKYIIIDEFQDISIGRYKLIKALKEVNPECKLFCVGDDWQSIYRFSGSDIALFKDFEKYFGFTEQARIETTYRFNEPVISASAKFILKNANQVKKSLKGFNDQLKTNFHLRYTNSGDQGDSEALIGILKCVKMSR